MENGERNAGKHPCAETLQIERLKVGTILAARAVGAHGPQGLVCSEEDDGGGHGDEQLRGDPLPQRQKALAADCAMTYILRDS